MTAAYPPPTGAASESVMLTLREAGELVSLGLSRIRALVRDGHVEAVKVEGVWLVEARSLLEYRVGVLAQRCGGGWSIDGAVESILAHGARALVERRAERSSKPRPSPRRAERRSRPQPGPRAAKRRPSKRRPAKRQRSAEPRLSAEPLLRQIRLAGGPACTGVLEGSEEARLLKNARRSGTLTVSTADHLAVTVLGMSLWELWPDELAEMEA